jgi:hypothetical protein
VARRVEVAAEEARALDEVDALVELLEERLELVGLVLAVAVDRDDAVVAAGERVGEAGAQRGAEAALAEREERLDLEAAQRLEVRRAVRATPSRRKRKRKPSLRSRSLALGLRPRLRMTATSS